MGQARIQLVVHTDRFPNCTASAKLSSWADVTREALNFYEWVSGEVAGGAQLRLQAPDGTEAMVVIPGLGGPLPRPPAKIKSLDDGGGTRASGVLADVAQLIEDTQASIRSGDAQPPVVPAELRTPEDAAASLQAAVWWAGHPGVPDVSLGQNGEQNARLNTAPVAVLSSILMSPGASKAELDATVAFVMSETGGKIPSTDSVGFWTSPRMQSKHGYVIGRENGQYRYDDRLPE